MTKKRLVALFLLVPILWVGSYFVLRLAFDTTAEMGTAGDSFGAINALFSGWALAGVIVALLMQQGELALQRKELQMTREELRGQ